MYVLEVMSGPLDGTKWRFEHKITIGREEGAVGACIAIDRYLSRSHAELLLEDEQVVLLDLSSRNGTTIDGQPVQRVALRTDQAFTCGRTLMRVVQEVSASDPLVLASPLSRISTIQEMRSRLLAKPVGFVPTMGALHAGHLRLIEQAQAECASVVVSIFVNPLQFAAGEDFAHYPRSLASDLQQLSTLGVTIVFEPDLAEFYPENFASTITIGRLGMQFEGELRPTHFQGVATVLAKLLHIVAPTRVYLGQKDAQQIAVLRQMIQDLNFPVGIVVVPTVREVDGLARSSRNVYLSTEERQMAPVLFRALTATATAFRRDASRSEACLVGSSIIQDTLSLQALDAELVYFDIVDPQSFIAVDDQHHRESSLAIGSLRLGGLRLIDNVPILHE